MSKSGDYENMTAGTNDDDAIIYQIASNQVNNIRYLAATRVLTIGTSGGEFVLTTTNDGPITPTNAQIRKYSNYGTAALEPVQVADGEVDGQQHGLDAQVDELGARRAAASVPGRQGRQRAARSHRDRAALGHGGGHRVECAAGLAMDAAVERQPARLTVAE